MTRSEETDTASRRGFLRSAGAGAAALSAGVAGASASASAQSENETGNETGEGHAGGETGGHSEGGQFVLTDSILMILGFVVVGVLSPIAFAVFLARKYRGDTPQ